VKEAPEFEHCGIAESVKS